MVMGRPTKPNELKRKTGTARPDRERPPLAVLPAATETPKPPTGLKRRGRGAWQRYWSLGAAWLSPTTDREIIERLCRAYDEIDEIRREMRGQPRVISSPNGKITHPLIGQLRKIEELVTRYEGLCGFTPSDRSRLGMAEVQRVSKLEQFLAQRG